MGVENMTTTNASTTVLTTNAVLNGATLTDEQRKGNARRFVRRHVTDTVERRRAPIAI